MRPPETADSVPACWKCAACRTRAQPVTISEIAQSHDISRSHLTKIVHQLGTHGLLANTRGRGGGIALLKDPKDYWNRMKLWDEVYSASLDRQEMADPLKAYHFHLLSATNNAGLLGIFRDNWGWDERSSYYQKIYYAANLYEQDGRKLFELLRDRWKFAPLVGEPGRTGPKKDWRPYSWLSPVSFCHALPPTPPSARTSSSFSWMTWAGRTARCMAARFTRRRG